MSVGFLIKIPPFGSSQLKLVCNKEVTCNKEALKSPEQYSLCVMTDWLIGTCHSLFRENKYTSKNTCYIHLLLIICDPQSCSTHYCNNDMCHLYHRKHLPSPSLSTFSSKNSSNQTHTVISLSWLLYMVNNNRMYSTTKNKQTK